MKEICRVNYVVVEKEEVKNKITEIIKNKKNEIKILEINNSKEQVLFEYSRWLEEEINFRTHNLLIITEKITNEKN